jgi:teichuronic acid biosynthesis glycosyltransferase TuaC
MRLLIIVANYPHAGHPYSGAFNERSARALKELGHQVEVLAPRPYVPRALAAWHARWRAYDQIAEQEIRGGVWVYRPPYLQLPGLGGVLRPDLGAYLSCVRALKRRHKNKPYDAILAFNMIGAGGLAWRLARRLDIPAAGWATGNDVRVPVRSAHGRAVRTALQRLDLVCYQSSELFERAADLCDLPKEVFSAGRHVVLPRGVDPAPPPSAAMRRSLRADLNVGADQMMVLFVGRIVKAKGVFELVDAVERVRRAQPNVVCVFVGAYDGFDDSAELRAHLRRVPELAAYVRLLPACPPEGVWQYLNAADIFAFPSHSEGMPNSLLEAMAAGLPALAYAIPPVLEIDDRLGALMTVPLHDVGALAQALADLARSTELQRQLGARGKERMLNHYQSRASMAEAARRLNALTHRVGSAVEATHRAPILSTGSTHSGVSRNSR